MDHDSASLSVDSAAGCACCHTDDTSSMVQAFQPLSVSSEDGCCQAMEDHAKDWSCPICLKEDIPFIDMAHVKGCNHLFCASCILNWVAFKDKAICPTCRTPFEMLLTYRSLDGTIYDKLIEENVCLLLRAEWFENKVHSARKGKNCAQRKIYGADDYLEAGDDYQEDDYFDEEEYYLSSTPSSSRTTVRLGNRRWGEQGYVKAGRMQARPSNSSSSKGKGKSKGKGSVKSQELSSSPDSNYKPAYETPVKKQGRRAKRTAKREALDRAIC